VKKTIVDNDVKTHTYHKHPSRHFHQILPTHYTQN